VLEYFSDKSEKCHTFAKIFFFSFGVIPLSFLYLNLWRFEIRCVKKS